MCDTLAVSKKYSIYKENLFGKNSDRPLGEAQPLVYIPSAKHPHGARLKCSEIEIDEAEETYAVIGSKPYWIWGFEMGVNEHGLVIGNEAQGSRNSAETEAGLLGMDLLRLGLERAKTANEAIGVITSLLERYGQNANASLLYDRRYENSFLLMDRQEIWILETAGRQWAAKQVCDRGAISNCYTIEGDFSISSENLTEIARENGWWQSGTPFSFTESYTLPAIRQNHSVPRYRRMEQMLAENDEHDFNTLKMIFRDHFDNTLSAPRFGAMSGVFYTLCMHPQDINAAKTAASLFVTYDEALGISMRHAFTTPCMSVYMPVYFTGYIPECMQIGNGTFCENSLWWQMERLNVAVSQNEKTLRKPVEAAVRKLEAKLEGDTAFAEKQAKELFARGDKKGAEEILNKHMDTCADKIMNIAKEQFLNICEAVGKVNRFEGPCRELLEWYDDNSSMGLLQK